MKILIAVNTAWNLVNFRSGLIRELVAEGYDVVAVAPVDAYVTRLAELGCRFVPLPMDSHGTNPFKDALLLWRFIRLLRQERPNVYLSYTVKPNVYGTLAAHFFGVPVINNIAGLGAVFSKRGLIVRFVRGLYHLTLRRSAKVFFQNNEDRLLFVARGLVRAEVSDLVPGSGIDLSRFHMLLPRVQESSKEKFRFLMIARMLWDKGVGEFVGASKVIHARWPQAEFCLLGFLDAQNPGAVSNDQMDELVAQGVVYLGASDDVRTEIAVADCIVLPSYYREGTPRTLLEAAAMGRPIITTDSVGCREVVDDGQNGYLCKVRDIKDLAEKMNRMLSLTSEERQQMSIYGRKKMEKLFDEKIVIKKYLDAIHEVCKV